MDKDKNSEKKLGQEQEQGTEEFRGWSGKICGENQSIYFDMAGCTLQGNSYSFCNFVWVSLQVVFGVQQGKSVTLQGPFFPPKKD